MALHQNQLTAAGELLAAAVGNLQAAGQLCLKVLAVRDQVTVLGAGSIERPPSAKWHDAEGMARIIRHPLFWVMVIAWNVGCILFFLQLA